MTPSPLNCTVRRTLLVALSVILASGCGLREDPETDSETGTDPTTDTDPVIVTPGSGQLLAFVATREINNSLWQVERISLTDDNTVTGSYTPTASAISVDTDGTNVYQLGQSGLNSVTRLDPLDTSLSDYQLSVNDADTEQANPQDLVFIDQTKGYLTRRGSDRLWIIDPHPDTLPATVDDFRIAELDLGAYDIDLPEMTDALIVDDKLFVLMERLTELPDGNQMPDKPGYIAVFDTRTDAEITTGQSGNNLKGIRLLTHNPTHLQYNESTGQVYVIGRGNIGRTNNVENTGIDGDFHTGGVEAIDPLTYQTTLLLDDGTDEDNNGFFLDGVVVNETLGYLITADYNTQASAQENTHLRSFDPTSGMVSEPLANLADASETPVLLAVGPDDHLWVGIDSSTPGFARIDLQSGEIAEQRIATTLVPGSITFLTVDQ